MLIPMEYLHRKYDMRGRSDGTCVNGVLHIGAHLAEEAQAYNTCQYRPVYWVEADQHTYVELKRRVSDWAGHIPVNAVLSDHPGPVRFHRASNGQSSSLLECGTHAQEHPDVVFTDFVVLNATTVDELYNIGTIGRCNFINLDVQGAELMVLKGGVDYLESVAYIYSEINCNALYKNCVLLPELDEWLFRRGFSRQETKMTPHGWGDAFYTKTIAH